LWSHVKNSNGEVVAYSNHAKKNVNELKQAIEKIRKRSIEILLTEARVAGKPRQSRPLQGSSNDRKLLVVVCRYENHCALVQQILKKKARRKSADESPRSFD